MSSKQLLTLAAVISGLTVCGAALATPSTITMNFDSLSSGTSVGDYYNGVGGPDYGVVWNGGEACSSGACSGPAFTGEPSSPNVLEIGPSEWAMNVPAGFTGDFSFYYYYAPHDFSQGFETYVWSELNGVDNYNPGYGRSSTVLASQQFSVAPPDPDCYISGCWQQANMTFSGIAESVEFTYSEVSESANIVLDDVSFTPAVTSVPEPGSLAMLGLGLVGLGFFASRKRRAK